MSGEGMTAVSEPVQLTVPQMLAQLQGTDTSLRYYAAWWLGKFGLETATAAERQAIVSALMMALADEADRTELGGYPLRRNAARALGKLGDRQAVPALIECLRCEDFYVREAAAIALGQLGDPQAIAPLQALLEGGVAMARLVPGRPHLVQPVEAVIESLGQLGATEAIALIEPFLAHEMPRVQFAAARALFQLTGAAEYGDRLLAALNSEDVQLRRTALLDLGAMGYLPAAEAILQAGVEASFKLIALHGILSQQLRQAAPAEQTLSLFQGLDQLL
ncbi:HEAT repeat domain-containing protein [Thermosynechococcus sp. CL-1]|uniref:HEAT repeat domain-containing protein n=1 Tax=unclassified Thermosynechococcus TaxID=2622553 RepID=UPI00122E0CFD|nr:MULTISPECIES: HEAT repeat domain-containing protein [unclassified Thermosynechococcus]QEQ00521.1 HEAT repeat domain-containing protein [Thermosynechococcus sp. CL-1]